MSWWLVALVGGPVAAVALDRLLLAAEARGAIYYRRRRPPAAALRSGMLTVMSVYEPGHEHIVNHRRDVATAVDEYDDDSPLDLPPRAAPPDADEASGGRGHSPRPKRRTASGTDTTRMPAAHSNERVT